MVPSVSPLERLAVRFAVYSIAGAAHGANLHDATDDFFHYSDLVDPAYPWRLGRQARPSDRTEVVIAAKKSTAPTQNSGLFNDMMMSFFIHMTPCSPARPSHSGQSRAQVDHIRML